MKLIQKQNGKYIWLTKYEDINCDDIKDVFRKGYKKAFVKLEEIEYALLTMEQKDHNCAEFGDVYRNFIFTRRLDS